MHKELLNSLEHYFIEAVVRWEGKKQDEKDLSWFRIKLYCTLDCCYR